MHDFYDFLLDEIPALLERWHQQSTARREVDHRRAAVPVNVDSLIVERQNTIDAPPERVWARIVTPEGINDELRPWMTMSMPRGKESLTVDDIPVGTPVGRCWMRLFGVLPFDYDDLMIAGLWPGRGFHEESTMLSMRLGATSAPSNRMAMRRLLCAIA